MIKKENILKNLIFGITTFFAIFLFTTVFRYTNNHEYKGLFFAWMIIYISALFGQWILGLKKNVKNQGMHYLYILISINISMFLSMILKYIVKIEVVDSKPILWVNSLISTFIVSLMMFVIKEVVWYTIAFKNKKMNTGKQEHVNANLENIKLRQENEELKEKIKELENDFEKIEESENDFEKIKEFENDL